MIGHRISFRFKKWPIVVSQIQLHKSKQKPFVVCCAEGIVPRIGEDGFQIVVILSACQICGFLRLGLVYVSSRGFGEGTLALFPNSGW